MAQKRITDLQLRDNFEGSVNLAGDDGIQTYRTTGEQIHNWLKPIVTRISSLLKNVGVQVTASAGAMTVALKQSDGSTALTSSAPLTTEVTFRSTTATSGGRSIVAFDSATSLVIPSGATLGFQDGENAQVYIYLYYDGTNKGLMLSSRDLDERELYSLTTIGTGSDADGLYADANRTGAAIRKIGEFLLSAITTAGTWTTPTRVSSVLESGVSDSSQAVFSKEGAYNMSWSHSAGTLKIVGGNGSPLSAANPGYVYMEKVSGGGRKLFKITADTYASFQDRTAGTDIDGFLFGTTTARAWATQKPFWLYAVNTDDTDAGIRFAIAALPAFRSTPSSGNRIGYKGNVPSVNTDLQSFFFMDSSDTTSFTSKPCLQIAGLTMQKDSSNEWALGTSIDFDRLFSPDPFVNIGFTYPVGHAGAGSATYLKSAGGTLPVFSASNYGYKIYNDRRVEAFFILDADGGTDGSGAFSTRITVPFPIASSSQNDGFAMLVGTHSIFLQLPGGIVQARAVESSTDQCLDIGKWNSSTFYENGDFTNGSRSISGRVTYTAAVS